MDSQMLDGNAAAGELREIFAVEMTSAIGTCNECGATEPLGAAHLYQSAGTALRCRHCENLLIKIVKSDTRCWLALPGVRVLELRG